MMDEIEAVKVVIRDFLRSEERGPGCYVLQPFNDLQDGRFDPASKWLHKINQGLSEYGVPQLVIPLSFLFCFAFDFHIYH